MTPAIARALERILTVATAVLASGLLALTATAIGSRLRHPFELEWMEGATVVHVARIVAGQSVYVEPSIDFVPFGYPALYYYAAAIPAAVMGAGFVPLRLVSITATVVTLVAIALIVRPAGGRLAAFVAAGAYAGAYPLSDGWFDLGRVDALYVSLLALVYAVVVRARTPGHWTLAGVLAAAAFTTKQPSMMVFAPLALYLLAFDRRAAAWFCGTGALIAAGSFAALALATDGWYAYYVIDLPRLRLGVSSGSDRLLSFWTADLLPFAGALVVGLPLVVRAREWRHLSLLAGLILSSWLSRLEGGAWNNAAMPAYLAGAVLLGLTLRRDGPALATRTAVVGLQLAFLVYDPGPFIPSEDHRAAGTAFLESLRSRPGPTLVLDHGYLPTMAGHREHAHGWAVTDLVWADRGGAGQKLEEEVRAAIRAHRFATIILDDERSWFYQDVNESYRRVGDVTAPPPVSGARRQPRFVYMPR